MYSLFSKISVYGLLPSTPTPAQVVQQTAASERFLRRLLRQVAQWDCQYRLPNWFSQLSFPAGLPIWVAQLGCPNLVANVGCPSNGLPSRRGTWRFGAALGVAVALSKPTWLPQPAPAPTARRPLTTDNVLDFLKIILND